MRRYKLSADKLINRLVPYYLNGRRYILLMQSLVYPLQVLNGRFMAFAKEKHIEARMTSQVICFEWYLNYKFGCYLFDVSDRIFLSESVSLGVDLYHENAVHGRPFTVWKEGEAVLTGRPEEMPREFYYIAEERAINKVSFMVNVPRITIPAQEFVYLLSHVVNTYKVAGKTYLIKIDGEEIVPNNNIKK